MKLLEFLKTNSKDPKMKEIIKRIQKKYKKDSNETFLDLPQGKMKFPKNVKQN
jgi:hypothetical protein